MSPKLIIFFALLWLICNLAAGVMEATYIGSTHAVTLATLFQPGMFEFSDPISGIGSIFQAGFTFLQALWTMITFDYAFLEGEYVILKYIGLCFSLGFIIMLVLTTVGAITGKGR